MPDPSFWISLAVLGILVAICMRRTPGVAAGEPLTGPRTFTMHRAWYVFMLVGGAFVVGIFAFAGIRSPQVGMTAMWCSVAGAALFGACILVLSRLRATLDGDSLVYRTALRTHTLDLRTLRGVRLEAMTLTLAFDPDRPGERARRVNILAGFKDLSTLIDALEARVRA